MRRIAAQVAIVAVIAVIGYGVHKSDENTQQQIADSTHATAVQTYNLCVARNKSIVLSNKRWETMKMFLDEAAQADSSHAATWRGYADSIQPTSLVDCGDAP